MKKSAAMSEWHLGSMICELSLVHRQPLPTKVTRTSTTPTIKYKS